MGTGGDIVIKLVMLAAAALLSWAPPVAAQGDTFDLKEWPVEWGGRTRDPAVAPDGIVWFVGQAGNYIANLDPKTGAQKKFEIEAGTNPHTLIVDEKNTVWYAGNRNGRIGRLDPATGAIKVIMTGEAKDPHTMVFDGKGHIWFTSQGSNRVGRLHIATRKGRSDHAVRFAVQPVRHRHRQERHALGRAASCRHGREDRSADDGRDTVQGGC